ncbi:MAG TPA: hypothetical protein VNA13_02880 [Xanthomonadales bacterium]|nr:hypothetical protein [Xanthomonadales bacterium]
MKKQKYISKIKNILYLICIFNILSLIFNISVATAQTITPKPSVISPTVSEKLNEKLNTQINQLKDKIASRVTELKLVEKRGATGVVSEVTTNKITLTDLNGNVKLIDIDEITKFSSSSAKGTFGLSDLTKGTKINVLGLYNKQSKRILARFIRTAVNPVFLSGTISEIDSNNLTITVISDNKKSTKVDIGSTTKLSSHTQDGGLVKILFPKLSVGERITTVGFPDKVDTALLVASRVVVLPDVPKDPTVSFAPSPTAAPTTSVLRRATVAPVVTSSVRRVSPTITR